MDPVIVAGAGPVGLTLALALARHDVPSIVLDESCPEDGDSPRTALLREDTTALLTRLGYRTAAADGVAWNSWRTLRRRHELLRATFAPGPRTGPDAEPAGGAQDLPAPLHLAQHRLEGGLRDAVAATDLVHLASDCRLDSLEQDDDGVTAHTGGGSATWWRGSFLVGCDGPRSTVRKLLGVRFPGRTAVDRYAVATLRTDLPFPGEARLHWDPWWHGDSEVTARPLPDGVWRLDWRLPPLSPGAQAAAKDSLLTPDALIARIRDTLFGWCQHVPPYELLASAEYLVHQRLARRWRVGRSFLAGDAAHLLGALGTQSVDEGLRDADNLAWKLAVAWHQRGADTLLDSYQTERRDAIGTRLRAADQALPLVRPTGALRGARRTVLSGSVRKHGPLLSDGYLGTGLLGAPPVYGDSPIMPPAGGNGRAAAWPYRTAAVPVGGPVVDVPVTALDGTQRRLRERLGRDLLIVLIAPGTGVWESRHWLTAGLMPPLVAATSALPMRAELLVAESYPGTTAHTVLVIRPDGHLAAAMTGFRPAELYACAELLRGGASSAYSLASGR